MNNCIRCGKEALLIDDLCSDCHMEIFKQDFLEPMLLKWGDTVRIVANDTNHWKVGKVVPPFKLARQIPANSYWIELASDLDGDLYRAVYRREDLKLEQSKEK